MQSPSPEEALGVYEIGNKEIATIVGTGLVGVGVNVAVKTHVDPNTGYIQVGKAKITPSVGEGLGVGVISLLEAKRTRAKFIKFGLLGFGTGSLLGGCYTLTEQLLAPEA